MSSERVVVADGEESVSEVEGSEDAEILPLTDADDPFADLGFRKVLFYPFPQVRSIWIAIISQFTCQGFNPPVGLLRDLQPFGAQALIWEGIQAFVFVLLLGSSRQPRLGGWGCLRLDGVEGRAAEAVCGHAVSAQVLHSKAVLFQLGVDPIEDGGAGPVQGDQGPVVCPEDYWAAHEVMTESAGSKKESLGLEVECGTTGLTLTPCL